MPPHPCRDEAAAWMGHPDIIDGSDSGSRFAGYNKGRSLEVAEFYFLPHKSL